MVDIHHEWEILDRLPLEKEDLIKKKVIRENRDPPGVHDFPKPNLKINHKLKNPRVVGILCNTASLDLASHDNLGVNGDKIKV